MITEKSVSVSQQRAAGLALAAKRGEVDSSKLSGASKEMMKMSEKDLEDFAKTKHKGLPMKKEGNKEEYKKVFDAALKKFNISSPGELKTDELKKKFFNYVDANYKAKDENFRPVVEKKDSHGELVHKYEKMTGKKAPSGTSSQAIKLMIRKAEKKEEFSEQDMKSVMKKLMGKDVDVKTTGASGFQKTMYHVSDDMYVTFNDKSKLGDVYYKNKNIDTFRGMGSPEMEKVIKKQMKKYGIKMESGGTTMTGKPVSKVKVENK
tara:strand:- start:1494 stop:2282 length:789 start_codon:yes stop_codon:yes gene_type:complete